MKNQKGKNSATHIAVQALTKQDAALIKRLAEGLVEGNTQPDEVEGILISHFEKLETSQRVQVVATAMTTLASKYALNLKELAQGKITRAGNLVHAKKVKEGL